MLLEGVKNILNQQKFECALIPATKNIQVDQLLVFLSLDAKKRERVLEIFSRQQEFIPEQKLPEGVNPPHRLEFRVKLPFKVQDFALNQVASLLHYINPLLDLPGFELNELEGIVSYRYVWIMEPALRTQPLIMSIVGAIMLNLGLFETTIESLADGKATFNDLLSDIVKMAESIKNSKH